MPTSDKQLAANRANAAKSTGPRTPEGKARSSRNARTHGFTASSFTVVRLEDLDEIARLKQDAVAVYRPVNSQELFALEQMAISQQTMLRAARLEAGLFTNCLQTSLNDNDTPFSPMSPALAGDGDIEITRAQNRNYALGAGFHSMAKQGATVPLFLRYKAQAERLYRRAVEDFDRLKALRPELPNEAILELQPQEDEPPCIPPDEPVSNRQSNPQHPAPDPTPQQLEQQILPAATTPLFRRDCRPRSARSSNILPPCARNQSALDYLLVSLLGPGSTLCLSPSILSFAIQVQTGGLLMRRQIVVWSLLILALQPTAARAADPTGTISGTVLDSSGAPVPRARVAVANNATGLGRETLTASDGGFVFPLVPVGPYTVSAEAPGFRRFEQRNVTITTDVNVTVPISLQLGDVTETVTVEARASLVETRSGTLGQVVTQQKIVELPLNGRNAATLVLLSPGTADLGAGNARGAGDVTHSADYPGAQAITSNGSRSEGVNYFLDGASNQDPWTNVNNPFPNPDALEEFSVQTNNYSAEYGRASGAVVNIVTKSGTNQLHGSLFEFLRNGAMNARNFFAPVPDHLKRNQYGATIGGPIIKDRLFFFGAWQGTQLRNISTGNTAFVLTPAQRNGDFSSVTRQLVDPLNGNRPIAGNIIPATRIDPATLKLLPLIPVSSSPDGKILFDKPTVISENQYMGRVDYNLGKHRLYLRYFDTKLDSDPISGKVNLVASGPGFKYSDRAVSFNYTFTPKPNLLNNVLFSYNRNDTKRVSAAPFGLNTIGVNVAQPPVPEISLSVTNFFSIATGRQGEFDRPAYDFSDNAHWIYGVHEISFGGEFLKVQTNVDNTFRQSGDFRFRGTTYSGNAEADFLLGAVDRFIQGGGDFRAQRGTLASLFVQDNIRVSRRLNLNLGLRWDPWIPFTEEFGRVPCYVPGAHSTRYPNAPAGYLLMGDSGCPDGGTDSRWGQLAPRVGFAYNMDGARTVIRGGVGIFYQPPFTEALGTLTNSAPFSPQFTLFGVAFDNPWAGTTNPFPASYGPAIPSKDAKFDIPTAVVALGHGWRPPRVASWNLAVERQLTKDVLARVAYAASKGTFLGYNLDLNPALFGPGANGGNTQARRPIQTFQNIVEDVSGGNSIYNSLQVSLEKRFSAGFNVSANYTFGKTIDQVSYLTDTCSVNVINPYNAGAYRAVSDYNVPHRFVLNYLWQLPAPKENALLRALVGGWQTTGIMNWQSGFPLNITSGEDDSLTGQGNDLADVIAKPSRTSGPLGQRINQWFTTSAFTTARTGTFGNVGRNILRGPSTFNLDFSIQRLFTIKERMKLQFRAEFFNGLNHTLLNNPNTTVTSSTFGRITSARDPRILQMALKLTF